MSRLIQYDEAGPEVRAVFDEIKAARGLADVNNFWKALAVDPGLLRQTWDRLRVVMAPGALDPLTKELLYIAISATAGCNYCVASHTASARAKGMTEAMHGELLAVLAMAGQTNRLAEALRVPVDPGFE